ncbi:PREDICTED: uncharacterized protein LOC105571051 [Vollenhovia emeryi]|uniref:uncharacterized protein LOC105571051 n=1 Tax=Vollenhovia emeryi TaxID=411798 RepID=UPI0005F55AFE|nr:PREDICTED: uncharacterized protein LOC105571051 [Vollenhovia emeryi]
MPIEEDSFTPAWNLLLSRYDNERLLITSQLEKLLNTTKIAVRSAKELNNLITSATEAYNALQALGCPVDQWDQVLVYSLSQRLDPTTREAWENDIGASPSFPNYTTFKDFVIGRARALESIEMDSPASTGTKTRTNTKSTSPSQQSAHGTSSKKVYTAKPTAGTSQNSAGSSTDMKKYPCSMCSNEHYVVGCPQFRQLTPEKRRELVVSKHLCFNCLGNHSVRACQSSKRCQLCNEKHHTMIHLNATSPPNNATKNASPQPSQVSSSKQYPAQRTETEE